MFGAIQKTSSSNDSRSHKNCRGKFCDEKYHLPVSGLRSQGTRTDWISSWGNKELVYRTPFGYVDLEETNERKLTGVRLSGGGATERTFIDLEHDRASVLLYGMPLSQLKKENDERKEKEAIKKKEKEVRKQKSETEEKEVRNRGQ